jgi:large subunit ribosomal protein L16
MLQPKRVKYRKSHKGHRRGKAQAGATVVFGDFGLQALDSAWITSRQIEAARRAIVRYVRRGGKVWIRIFPDKSVTKKAAETRMGSGKGAPDHWVSVVRRGRVLFELSGVSHDLAKEAMRLASYKLPIDTRFVVRGAGEASGGLPKKELTQVES